MLCVFADVGQHEGDGANSEARGGGGGSAAPPQAGAGGTQPAQASQHTPTHGHPQGKGTTK